MPQRPFAGDNAPGSGPSKRFPSRFHRVTEAGSSSLSESEQGGREVPPCSWRQRWRRPALQPISRGLVAGIEAVAFLVAPEHVLAAAAGALAAMPVMVLGHDELRPPSARRVETVLLKLAACTESGAKATAIASAEAMVCIFFMGVLPSPGWTMIASPGGRA